MKLNIHERKIFNSISENSGITTRKLMKLSNMGTRTFYTYSRTLLEKNKVVFAEVGNTHRWYIKTSELPDFAKTKREFEYEVKRIQRSIKRNLKLVEGRHHSQVLSVYQASLIAIFSFLETIDLLEIRTKPQKIKFPNYILNGRKKISQFLKTIINDMSPLRYDLSVNTMLGRYHFNMKGLEEYEKSVKLLDKKSKLPNKLKKK